MAIPEVERGLLQSREYRITAIPSRFVAFVKFWNENFLEENRLTDRRDTPPLAAAISLHGTYVSRGYLQSISRACSRS